MSKTFNRQKFKIFVLNKTNKYFLNDGVTIYYKLQNEKKIIYIVHNIGTTYQYVGILMCAILVHDS